MGHSISISSSQNKEDKYSSLIPQIEALIGDEEDLIANLSNISAALKEAFGFLWVGWYYRASEAELVLGPFQGPVACTRIKKGKGVCGTCWEKDEVQLIPDVEKFPGHIACSPDSRSEIVLPVHNKEGDVCMVLDIDSAELDGFDDIDRKYLQRVVALLEPLPEGM